MTPLPRGWAWAKLGELCDLINGDRGKNYPSKDALVALGVPFINAGHLTDQGTIDITSMNYISEERFEILGSGKVRKGDVLYCLRGSLGKAAIVRELDRGAIASSLVIVRAREGLIAEYTYHFLVSPEGKRFIRMFDNGTAQPNLAAASVGQYEVPVPPLNEQRRIVDELDAIFERAHATKARLERLPASLDKLKRSILAAATSGELTRDWREEHGIDDEWATVDLKRVADDFSYGSAAKSSKSGKVPVLRMGNIQDGLLDWNDLVFTSDTAEIAKYKLSDGDVLFNRTNSPELVGKTAVFHGEREAIYAGYLIRVRCGDQLLPDYLNYCLGSPAGREYCWQVKSDGVSQSNINAQKLAAFAFGLPSIEEQCEIIRRVGQLLGLNGILSTKVQGVSALAERLAPAVLAKAFRGELVPQDPNDEPASELLARLKAQPASAPTKQPRRGRKPQGASTMSTNDKDAVKSAILKLKAERFSFDDLRAQLSGDYDMLKAALFELLEEPSPVVRQVFDKKAKAMQLERVPR